MTKPILGLSMHATLSVCLIQECYSKPRFITRKLQKSFVSVARIGLLPFGNIGASRKDKCCQLCVAIVSPCRKKN